MTGQRRLSNDPFEREYNDGVEWLKKHGIDTPENKQILRNNSLNADSLAAGLVSLHVNHLEKYLPLLIENPKYAASIATRLHALKDKLTDDIQAGLLKYPKDGYVTLELLIKNPANISDFFNAIGELRNIYQENTAGFEKILQFIIENSENAFEIISAFILLKKENLSIEENKQLVAQGGKMIVMYLIHLRTHGLLEDYHEILKLHPAQAIMISDTLLHLKISNNPEEIKIARNLLEKYPQFAPQILGISNKIRALIHDNELFATVLLRALQKKGALPETRKEQNKLEFYLMTIIDAFELLRKHALENYNDLLLMDPMMAPYTANTLILFKGESELLENFRHLLFLHPNKVSLISLGLSSLKRENNFDEPIQNIIFGHPQQAPIIIDHFTELQTAKIPINPLLFNGHAAHNVIAICKGLLELNSKQLLPVIQHHLITNAPNAPEILRLLILLAHQGMLETNIPMVIKYQDHIDHMLNLLPIPFNQKEFDNVIDQVQARAEKPTLESKERKVQPPSQTIATARTSHFTPKVPLETSATDSTPDTKPNLPPSPKSSR